MRILCATEENITENPFMPKNITLKHVEADIAEGNLGKARDRLHGLLFHYPDDLSLRRRLAEIYFQLQYPERAGCYWFLEKHKTEEMQRAVDIYVQSKGGDPILILRGLRIGFDPEKNLVELRPGNSAGSKIQGTQFPLSGSKTNISDISA